MSYDILFQQALNLHNAGYFDRAEKIYRQILETAPNNPDVLNLMGLIAQVKGIHGEAAGYFYKALKETPKHAPLYFNLAVSLNELGKYYESIDMYNRAIELNPDIAEAYNNLGLIFLHLGEDLKAKEFFSKSIEINPDFADAKANLALAEKDYDTLRGLNIPIAAYYLSLLYQGDGNFEKALEYALKTEEYNQIAELYLLTGDIKKAESYLKYCLSANPSSASALINLANIETNRKLFDDAEKKYKKALDISPDDVNAHINYANMLYLSGRLHEALEENRKAVVLNSDIPEISNNIGIIQKDFKEYEQAVDLFFNAFAKNPGKDEFAINIAETLQLMVQSGKNEEAVKIAKKWKELFPKNTFAIHSYASLTNDNVLQNDAVYSEKLFEHFAENYEDTLKNINYNLPNKIKEKARSIEGRILDLGCGTGLLGIAIKNDKNKIIGVDISANMLRKAKEKNVYDDLICADIASYLQEKQKFDWTFAADVFSYIGNLENIISMCDSKNLCFSIESGENEDFYLTETGRYKHNETYIDKILQKNSFNAEKHEINLRLENGVPVKGMLFLARKRR
ncbi:MAG: tetratricopeptide repeat protein [Lactobacillaceae bacterium]|jgi:predicted TPR repeat methyltransferase|nr:tetratricopeptide repeat protein [Lactobacillaceae bacterium]